MPTPGGLPKPGEFWIKLDRGPSDKWKWHWVAFRVIERSRGDYWSMRVRRLAQDGESVPPEKRQPVLWVDCAYWLSQGYLKFLGTDARGAKVRLAQIRAEIE